MAEDQSADAPRQRVVRVPGARRAKLTAVPGADVSPEPPLTPVQKPPTARRTPDADPSPKGPNDDRMREDVPPHY
jgi:hypothetical protein